MGLNYIVLSGEVTSSPEKKYTPDGQPVTGFNVAVSLSEDSSETINSHIKVSASRKLADRCLDEVKKGSVVLVEGKLYTKVSENRFAQKQKLPYIQATNVQVIKEKDSFEIPIPIFSESINEIEKIDDEEIPF